MHWILDHPLIVWPIVSAVITTLFKPRTPEQYAALPPRIAALLRFVGALGIDAPKVVETLRQMAMGGKKP